MSTTTPAEFTLEAFFRSLRKPATTSRQTVGTNQPAWEGMPADEAFLLIEETAVSLSDIARLMENWRQANTHTEAA